MNLLKSITGECENKTWKGNALTFKNNSPENIDVCKII